MAPGKPLQLVDESRVGRGQSEESQMKPLAVALDEAGAAGDAGKVAKSTARNPADGAAITESKKPSYSECAALRSAFDFTKRLAAE